MISQKLQSMLVEAMKAHDSLRVETLRMLSSAFNYEKINLQHDLSEEEEMSVVRKQVKQRRDSIDSYKKAGAEDRAQKEEDEMKILQEFLPPEMGGEELEKIVDEAIETVRPQGMQDMGKVVGFVKSKAPNADGSRVAQVVNQKLAV